MLKTERKTGIKIKTAIRRALIYKSAAEQTMRLSLCGREYAEIFLTKLVLYSII